MTCLPCPFCAAELKATFGFRGNVPIGFGHPAGDCILSGWHIGVHTIARFNARAGVVGDVPALSTPQVGQAPQAGSLSSGVGLFMTLATGVNGQPYPIFNSDGHGRAVSLAMVNDTVVYYRDLSTQGADK
jgi:hypothetical protein